MNLSSNVPTRKKWSELKSIVEFGRKFLGYLNGDIVSNVQFREYYNPETGQDEIRVYFLSGFQNRNLTIKYIDISGELNAETLNGIPLFPLFHQNFLSFQNDKKLTKEEQLLRERQRISFSGITSFSIDEKSGRIIFGEHSELFYFDDEIPSSTERLPIEISTFSKGAIDFKICPVNSNIISYILNDNLWIQDLSSGREIQLTFTADPKKSGVPSFAAQEEFDRYTGYWWQPFREQNNDGTTTYKIIYEEIDDQDVDLTYITPSCENEFGYDTYRYPKAGTPNSKIHLKLIEIILPQDSKSEPLINRKKMHMSFYELFPWFEYMSRADWTPNGKYFWTQLFNRMQTRTVSLAIDVDFFVPDVEIGLEMQTSFISDAKKVFVIDEQSSDAWINYNDKMYFLNQFSDDNQNAIEFITANESTGFMHLFRRKLNLLETEKYNEIILRPQVLLNQQLTQGDWSIELEDNVYVDLENNLVYFTAFQDPIESHLFVVDYNKPGIIKQLTQSGSSHSISMDKKCKFFVTTFSNLSNPNKTLIFEIVGQNRGIDGIGLRQVTQITNQGGSRVQIMLDSFTGELNQNFANISGLLSLNLDTLVRNSPNDDFVVIQNLFKPPQIFSFETDDNCRMYGMIYMPYNYEDGVKYKTLLYVYAGPRFQIVTNSYKASKYSRFNILALLGYCVVAIDSRGSKNRGRNFENHIYKKMGTVEISDQVKGLEAASKIYDCIDMNRVGIFGWSYGGYMSLMGLAQRPDIFKVAISGAPVTTWKFYDTAYTERYMGLPREEPEAYENGSVISLARNFPDEENRLLIIHGMIDENVHFAHTRKLIDALIKENKPYQLLIFPHERHGIRSPEGSTNCDTNIYSFLERNL